MRLPAAQMDDPGSPYGSPYAKTSPRPPQPQQQAVQLGAQPPAFLQQPPQTYAHYPQANASAYPQAYASPQAFPQPPPQLNVQYAPQPGGGVYYQPAAYRGPPGGRYPPGAQQTTQAPPGMVLVPISVVQQQQQGMAVVQPVSVAPVYIADDYGCALVGLLFSVRARACGRRAWVGGRGARPLARATMTALHRQRPPRPAPLFRSGFH